MKLLYLTFQEDAPLYLGVTRKIAGQARAFEKLGFDVTYTLWGGGSFRFYSGGKTEEVKITSSRKMMKTFESIAESYISKHAFDVIYFRLDRISFGVINLCRFAKNNGTGHVIIEIPNYPYLKDYIRNIKNVKPFKRRAVNAAKVLATAAGDRLSGLFLRKAADAAVLIGDKAESFFGVRAVNINNGINAEEFSCVKRKDSGGIVMVGVAGTLWWQAYDRVLEGMCEYKKNKACGAPDIHFTLVGGDEKEMPAFWEQVKKYGLQDDVDCPGFKSGAELKSIYSEADVGISSLGCYRRGLKYCSSLKAREYCAAGLPFVYAYEDDDLNGDLPFALKFPNDPTPIDIDKVAALVSACRADPLICMAEKEFARSHYDWVPIMERVLAFAGININ
jgi:glycosyltransferase involved in cell wall biosynthesis